VTRLLKIFKKMSKDLKKIFNEKIFNYKIILQQ
jgi:hypothetical protein